jgi:hypothetical protein
MTLFNRVIINIAPLKHLSIPRFLFIVPLLLLIAQPLFAQEVPLALPGQEAEAAAPRAFLESQTLTSPNPETFDLYGSTLAIEGNVIVVGSPYDNNNTGAVYVYEPDASGVWSQTAKLVPDTANLSNLFGWALDLEGGVVAVGAPSESAVYLFAKDGSGVWTQQQKIEGDVADGLGSKVILNGTLLAAQAYYNVSIEIYQLVSLVWQFQSSIELVTNGNPNGIFAFDGDTLLQGGAYGIDGAGEVLSYEFTGTEWEVTQRLRGSVRTSAFGASVAIKGDEAFISSQDPYTYGSPSIEVFENQNGVWVSKQVIEPIDYAGSYGYPSTLVIADNYLISTNFYNSAVYLYTYNGTEWEFADRITKQPPTPQNPQPNYFGYAVDFSGGTLVASMPYSEEGGKVYLFGRLDYEPTVLLVNGGFEDDVNGWTLKNASSDKVKCADASTPAEDIAWEGNCAFTFKGKLGEDATLKQTIEADLVAGTNLYFGGYAKVKGPSAYSRIKVALSYVDNSVPSSKLTLDVFSFGGEPAYVPLSFYIQGQVQGQGLTIPVIAAAEKVKVQINSFGESGKIFFDELSLVAR